MQTKGCQTPGLGQVKPFDCHHSHNATPLVKRSIVRPRLTSPGWHGIKLTHRPSSSLGQTTVQPVSFHTEDSPGLDEAELASGPATNSTQPISWTARWWPVIALESLQPKIPQHVDLLGKSLVVWADSKSQWHCLEDKCPHRLAPLSEGRVEGDTLMCSYHGWTFNASGACTNIPQLNHDPKAKAAACSSKRSCARAYPARPAHGLLWVWPEAGPEAEARAASTPAGGEVAWGPEIPYSERTPWYVRHVPMRYDMLMENFLDPTHVAFSHHGVGMMDRKKPFTVKIWAATTLGPVTAEGFTARALESGSEMVFKAPLMTKYDYKPINMGPQLLAVPTKPGWSQLFWSYPGHMDKGIIWKVPLLKLLFIVRDHLMSRNALIDGDTYMVHVAERAMPVSGGIGISSAAKLYYMPYTGDLAVVGLRKWLEQFGGDIPTCSPRDQQHMFPALPHEQALDRWAQHTKDCPHCKAGLALLDQVRSFCVALGALAGAAATAAAAAAASTAAATATAGAVSSQVSRLLGSSVACAVVVALCVWVHRALEPWRRKFFYEEYIHALRD